jgi:hypothetical protein
MKKILKSTVLAAVAGTALFAALPTQAFWGPFDWFDDDDYYGPWGGPWGGYPGYHGYPGYWGGYPGYYGYGYPGYGYPGYGYPGYGYGYPYAQPYGYPYAAPAAPESTKPAE